MIAVVYHDDDAGPHADWRGGLLCAPDASQVYLFGCSLLADLADVDARAGGGESDGGELVVAIDGPGRCPAARPA